MWKPIETPGEWLIFLQREDIKSLPIMEARKKYMQEQLLFEAYENNLNTVNTVNTTTSAPASAAAGGGGQRKFKYAAQYQLAFRGGGDGGNARGTYDRVAISDLKRYWYDNFFDSRNGGFTIPPPSIPSNIGSDFFFIKQNETTAALITWGTLGRGRQKGQWTYSEYKIRPLKIPVKDCYRDLNLYDKWNTFGFGSTNLSTPAGKWSINDVVDDGGKIPVCDIQRNTYVLEENKTSPLETLRFAYVNGSPKTQAAYEGNYSRNGVNAQGNPIWERPNPTGSGIYTIYYSTSCGGWKLDLFAGIIKLACDARINAGSTIEDGPLGTYTFPDSSTKPSGTEFYAVTQN